MTDTNERRTAGRATGLLWLVGGISGAAWLAAADRRLRHAKDGGKDRWIARSETDLHVHAS